MSDPASNPDLFKWWRLEMFLLVVFAAAVLGILFWNSQNQNDWVETEGEVVRFGMISHEVGNLPLAIVKLDDGRQVQVKMSRASAANCTAGDRIALRNRGLAYRVSFRGCSADGRVKH